MRRLPLERTQGYSRLTPQLPPMRGGGTGQPANAQYLSRNGSLYRSLSLSRSALVVPSFSRLPLPVLFPSSPPFRSLVRSKEREKNKMEERSKEEDMGRRKVSSQSFSLSLLVFFIFSFLFLAHLRPRNGELREGTRSALSPSLLSLSSWLSFRVFALPCLLAMGLGLGMRASLPLHWRATPVFVSGESE